MKKLCLAVFLFVCGLFSVHAQDLIILKNGTIIEAKVMKISSTEIEYKRFNHQDGPTIAIPTNNVLSIRYENGTSEVINETVTGTMGATPGGAATAGGSPEQMRPPISPLQATLNSLPAIRVAGNSLKFEFIGDTWTAQTNGENFSAGTLVFEETADGGTLTLQQTHIWPGAVGKTAGRVAGSIANLIPGGAAVGNVLNAAGDIAGVVGGLAGAVEAPGTEIILEYKARPRPSLRLISVKDTEAEARKAEREAQRAEAVAQREQERAERGQYSVQSDSEDSWKKKFVYLGGGLGGGMFGYTYNRGYSYSYYEEDNLFAFGFVSEFALLPFFSIELDLALASGGSTIPVIPILAKVGGRFAKVELSFDIGYTVGAGLTYGGTFGFKAGPGVLFAKGLYIPDGGSAADWAWLALVGYKWGIGRDRGRAGQSASSSAYARPASYSERPAFYTVDLSTLPMVRNEKPFTKRHDDLLIPFPEFPVDVASYSRITIRAKYFDSNGNEIRQNDDNVMVTLIYDVNGDIRGPSNGTGSNTPLKEFHVGGFSGNVHRDRGVRIRLRQAPGAILFQNANPSVKYIEVTEITFHDRTR